MKAFNLFVVVFFAAVIGMGSGVGATVANPYVCVGNITFPLERIGYCSIWLQSRLTDQDVEILNPSFCVGLQQRSDLEQPCTLNTRRNCMSQACYSCWAITLKNCTCQIAVMRPMNRCLLLNAVDQIEVIEGLPTGSLAIQKVLPADCNNLQRNRIYLDKCSSAGNTLCDRVQNALN